MPPSYVASVLDHPLGPDRLARITCAVQVFGTLRRERIADAFFTLTRRADGPDVKASDRLTGSMSGAASDP
ncbi:hypothetical protein GCM10014719_63220 [Planomonospora parontospora subsp. antibiotica]|nr:hypothetical protein GCM10014719_63220 [Planomonospora parontospora subsp. antibiotica]GII19527.1 hypothetical protein Ppa05_62530 [Planomonospora parontospora subsp. antibiotica]